MSRGPHGKLALANVGLRGRYSDRGPPHPLWCSALSLPLGEQGSYGLKRQSQKDEMPPKQGSTVGRLPLLKHGAISTLLFSLFKLEELFIMFLKDRPKQITGGVCLAASSATVTLLGT